jgi:hypothetical protein
MGAKMRSESSNFSCERKGGEEGEWRGGRREEGEGKEEPSFSGHCMQL